MSATIGVSMVPGHTALMRMPLAAYSSAALFVIPITPMFGSMVHGAAGKADQAADRRAVDDGAISLLAHLAQLVFHAVPNAVKIDRLDAIVFLAAGVGHLHRGRLDAGVATSR